MPLVGPTTCIYLRGGASVGDPEATWVKRQLHHLPRNTRSEIPTQPNTLIYHSPKPLRQTILWNILRVSRVDHGTSGTLNPLNQMSTFALERAPGQTADLPLDHETSPIPLREKFVEMRVSFRSVVLQRADQEGLGNSRVVTQTWSIKVCRSALPSYFKQVSIRSWQSTHPPFPNFVIPFQRAPSHRSTDRLNSPPSPNV